MPITERFLPAWLAEQAGQQPDLPAFTFVDYAVDPAGDEQTLTWSQTWQQVQTVAAALAGYGSPGDRVAICAPQGLEYVVGLLGAMQAGRVVVPLSVPMLGRLDERVSAILTDSAPAAVLTTSAAVDEVVSCVRGLPGETPTVIEVDALGLGAPPALCTAEMAPSAMALLQYTSGSTRAPAGIAVTHHNIISNLDQIMADYFEDQGGAPPKDATPVSWLPFYHDMGLMFGIFIPVRFGYRSVLTDPVAFLTKPARWMRLAASYPGTVTPAPNFAYELTLRRTSDDDMAGYDLGGVHSFISGAERVHAPTVKRFLERFARFNLAETALRAAYGLAEATVYVASSNPGLPARRVRFDYDMLSAGIAQRCRDDQPGSELVGHGTPRACTVRIVDPDNRTENPAAAVGEIWIHGDNVTAGYWKNPQLTQRTFGGELVDPAPGTPRGPWLRTGDLGVIYEGELFVVARIKDVLIVDGRNHYPDDIEVTVQNITRSRSAAISVLNSDSEHLVVIAELKQRGDSDDDACDRFRAVKREVTAAVSKSHGVRVADLVVVAPGSIPITTSGKVRRAACAERYRRSEFSRLDVPV